jgi:hypothetical protein
MTHPKRGILRDFGPAAKFKYSVTKSMVIGEGDVDHGNDSKNTHAKAEGGKYS